MDFQIEFLKKLEDVYLGRVKFRRKYWLYKSYKHKITVLSRYN